MGMNIMSKNSEIQSETGPQLPQDCRVTDKKTKIWDKNNKCIENNFNEFIADIFPKYRDRNRFSKTSGI